MKTGPWIGVDLDGTLAEYHGWKGPNDIGAPIPAMHNRILQWLREGRRVKIFTARAAQPEQVPAIRSWLDAHGMEAVEITNIKDFGMTVLWDDRTVRVTTNTGEPCCISAFLGQECPGCPAKESR